MSDMKFKFTIQPYQTEAVESVINVFAGQPFNDRFTYRRDAQIERDVTNWKMTDEELYMGFANARVQLDGGQLLENIRKDVVADISHELKTPLAIISSQVEMLQCMDDKIDRSYYYSSIVEEVSRMSDMVGELMDLSV